MVKVTSYQIRVLLSATLILWLTSAAFAQSNFFEFVPGWRGAVVVEHNSSYVQFGTAEENWSNRHSVTRSYYDGTQIESYQYIDDTLKWINALSTGAYLRQSDRMVVACFGSTWDDTVYSTIQQFDLGTLEELSAWIYPVDDYGGFRIIENHATAGFLVMSFARDENLTAHTRLYHIDTTGAVLWQQEYYSDEDEVEVIFNRRLEPYHLMHCPDQGYLLTCKERLNTGGSDQYYEERTVLIKTDSLGNEQWRIRPGPYTETWIDPGWPVMLDNGNFMFFWGDPRTIDFWNDQPNDEATVRFAEFSLLDGNMLYEGDFLDVLLTAEEDPTYGHSYTVTQCQMLDDGSILISGFDLGAGMLIKISQTGEVLWSRNPNPAEYDSPDSVTRVFIYGVTPTSDGGFVCTGEYRSEASIFFPTGLQSAFVMKLDEYGCLEPGCQFTGIDEIIMAGLTLYPNPTTGVVQLQLPERVGSGEVVVTDLSGREVLRRSVSADMSAQIELDLLARPRGIYIVQLRAGGGVYVGKVVVE